MQRNHKEKTVNNSKTVLLSVAALVAMGAYLVQMPATAFAKTDADARSGAGLTVYHDTSRFGRKTRAAKKMTELHDEHFEKGWSVIDVDPYIENGDLQGFFITYVQR